MTLRPSRPPSRALQTCPRPSPALRARRRSRAARAGRRAPTGAVCADDEPIPRRAARSLGARGAESTLPSGATWPATGASRPASRGRHPVARRAPAPAASRACRADQPVDYGARRSVNRAALETRSRPSLRRRRRPPRRLRCRAQVRRRPSDGTGPRPGRALVPDAGAAARLSAMRSRPSPTVVGRLKVTDRRAADRDLAELLSRLGGDGNGAAPRGGRRHCRRHRPREPPMRRSRMALPGSAPGRPIPNPSDFRRTSRSRSASACSPSPLPTLGAPSSASRELRAAAPV